MQLATSETPLPSAVEHLSCRGATIYVTLNPETFLPQLLRRAVPKVQLELRFRRFEGGVAYFSLSTNVLALPAHRLLNLLTAAIALPGGVSLHKGDALPELRADAQALLEERLSGVFLDEFYLHEGNLIAVARIDGFRRL